MSKNFGFKHTGRGPKTGHSFSSKAGFTHSGTNRQNVKGYTRSSPKPKYAHGGPVAAPMSSGDSSVIKRVKPVTGFDAEHGGKSPLRPGFNKGGKACYAEGGKVKTAHRALELAEKMFGGPEGRESIGDAWPKTDKEAVDFIVSNARENPTRKDVLKYVREHRKSNPAPKKFAEGGKVATTGAAIKMMKELMKRGNSAEDAATKAARRYGVSPSSVKAPSGPTGGGGMAAEKQMLARGGMAKMINRVVPGVAQGAAARNFVPAPQGQKTPGRTGNHMVTGYGSFGRRPLVG